MARQVGTHAISRVPEITFLFWVIKVLTTGMGESASDFLVKAIDPPVAVAIGAAALAVALALQFRARRYIPVIYWMAVAMVAVFGTMAADVLHVAAGIPYAISTAFYAVVLGLVFIAWHRSEGTLSIHSITTPRREAFYWATVLATFALGTAAGDLTAITLGWGYLLSGILFAIVFAVPAILYWRLERSEVATFWFAYVVTRPLGASFADWLGKPRALGGLDIGDGTVAAVLAVLIVVLVAWVAWAEKPVPRTAGARLTAVD